MLRMTDERKLSHKLVNGHSEAALKNLIARQTIMKQEILRYAQDDG